VLAATRILVRSFSDRLYSSKRIGLLVPWEVGAGRAWVRGTRRVTGHGLEQLFIRLFRCRAEVVLGVVGVEIRSNHGLGHVEISGWEIEGEEYPSFRCEVFAEAQGFQGKNTVHFGKEDLDEFLVELEDLERTLTGTATLRSMSPDELVLTLKPKDRLGRVLVSVILRKYVSMDHGVEDYTVNISLETDQTVLSHIRSDLAAQAARLG